ncbi:MAG TPA: UvrD-helicase domain-containing protein, partial [Acidimicrobiales bacterium]|nr:UvrD-helicase domain-containing protein [Acidimicrobiales bacterium]
MTTRTDGPAPADQAERDRIVTALDQTLFVQAAAGSGKTRALVDRIVHLVVTGASGLDGLAAITFTEKAAAELRDRVRRSLDDELARASVEGERATDPAVAERVTRALADLDSAAIGTLHSFAQRLLTEHPIEAGLPPRVEVLDEVASAVAFDDRWSRFVDRLLADPAVEHALLLATAAGVRIDHLRLVALGFDQNWDLALTHAPDAAPEVAPWSDDLMALLDEADAIVAERDHCCDGDDKLLAQLDELEIWARRVRDASDEYTRLSLLGSGGGRPRARALGRAANWPSLDVKEFKQRYGELGARIDGLRQRVIDQAVRRLAVDLRRFTLESAAERRDAGELEFHDLLVLARQMLRDPTHGRGVRTTLHARYRHLLIDEFQDTDPIQIELAVLIAGPPDEGPDDVAWDAVGTRPGHLFFVGDPKQSIYRFRRADISLFLRAAERFGTGTGAVALTTNFRTGTGLIQVVNAVFAELIRETEREGVPSQPPYVPFVPVRPDAPVGPPVAVVGTEPHDQRATAGDMRLAEAAGVADAIERIVGEGWLVDRAPHGTTPCWEPARLGDITILIPTRTSLPALEDALSGRGISYRAESASLVYASRLVRDLLLTLRAIDDPTDELVVVSALRSPLFGCGDDDLYRFHRDRRAGFDHSRPLPTDGLPGDGPAPAGADAPSGDAAVDHDGDATAGRDDADADPVLAGLAYLREMHEQRRWLSPSELVDRVVRDRRVLELGEADGRARDLWRRVRFVVDQARAWTDATNGTLRQYLAWIRQQTAEGSRVSEAVLPETDDDAVRIMTVHASKGLEFPVTIVSGMSTQPSARRAGAEVVWPPGQECIIRVGKTVVTEAFESWKPIDEQMSHDERIRLLYVACTRAQDHLVVSLHRRERASEPDDEARYTNAELMVRALGDTLGELTDLGALGGEAGGAPARLASWPHPSGAAAQAELPFAAAPDADDRRAGTEPPPLPPFEAWRRARDHALSTSRRPRTVAATALTDDGRPDVLA